jgi:hypothetical protein
MSSEDAVSTRAVADLADGDERHPLPEAAPSRSPEAGFTHTLRVMAVAERAVFCLSLALCAEYPSKSVGQCPEPGNRPNHE